MAKSKARRPVSNGRASEKAANKSTAAPSDARSDSGEDVEMQSNDPMEKDSTEEELERLVFGDDAGFREHVKAHAQSGPAVNSGEEGEDIEASGEGAEEDEGVDLGAVHDDDLFFIDTGPSTSDPNQLIPPETPADADDDEDETLRGNLPPAWIDSDDERITVSLANNPRLRKLRVTATEDLVNGKEYTKRLRKQFERLYPVPAWALPSSVSSTNAPPKNKRRHISTHASATDKMDLDSSPSSSSDEETLSATPLAKILQSAASLTTSSSTTRHAKLRPEVIDIQRLKDVGGTQPSSITSLSFHPTLPLLLTAGPSSLISLFHITPSSPTPSQTHPLLTSLHVPSSPLTSVSFLPPQANTILLSSRRRYYHTWSLPTGAISKVSRIYGHADSQRSFEHLTPSPCGRYLGLISTDRKAGGAGVNILSATTSQWIAAARGPGSKNGLAAFAWWSNGEGLTLVGKGGDVVEWSMSERRVVASWQDDGGVGTTVLGLGGRCPESSKNAQQLGGDRWVAIGSTSGLVNLYDRLDWSVENLEQEKNQRPRPTKTLKHLTTPISKLVFAGDGQLLAVASMWKKDALRLVHLPSCTVYRNWPTGGTPLGRITSVAFSPDVGEGGGRRMLAVGSEAGRVRLWEIQR